MWGAPRTVQRTLHPNGEPRMEMSAGGAARKNVVGGVQGAEPVLKTCLFFFFGSGSLFNGHADPGTHTPGYKTPYPDAHPASRRPRPARGTPARRSHTPRGQTETATLPLTWSRVRDGRLYRSACDHARPQEYGRAVSHPPLVRGAGVTREGRLPRSKAAIRL